MSRRKRAWAAPDVNGAFFTKTIQLIIISSDGIGVRERRTCGAGGALRGGSCTECFMARGRFLPSPRLICLLFAAASVIRRTT
ncbi:hypothetical protein EVAR_37026_1 [Eumeta japonica]|uniref:Uncharacterized protein n=1 Tax=Eumeta variegata TaxID=151549 RepID=A0A4C1WFT0_EUMVA|nr:hypothetical protein EVAR_37026_1 [Eumeta japonica]